MKTRRSVLIGAIVALSAIFLFASSLKIAVIDTKDLLGAWEHGPDDNHSVLINTDKVFAVATYDVAGKKFIQSYGGTWRLDGNKIIRMIEWDSKEPARVGQEVTADIKLNGNRLLFSGSDDRWNRLDNGKSGELRGAWIITGNFENDKASKRPAPFYPRRTMKILSGTQFHWIAYNVQTKQFMNAGGGDYTAKDGNYTEHIKFFTKTPESVGKTVNFQYSFVDGDWRHKGQKSTGGPLDECWTKRERLEK